jgi:hypothetical protein
MNYSKVQGHPDLVRDENTKAILNTNMEEYKKYMAIKKSKELEVARIKNLESDVNLIKNDLDEIKNLLRSLANGS